MWDCKAYSDYFYKRSFNRPLKIDKPIFLIPCIYTQGTLLYAQCI
ncbi:hypothetical protein PSM_A2043 [Pseudoalteromonas sp. SM9913]|nr:hypothetical protein PSM_A2043 [Pseudoalteromonas sp. SM9913]